MKKFFCILVSAIGVLLSAIVIAENVLDNHDIYPVCHAHAMIGFDSVINSRLGVPAEQVIDVIGVHEASSSGKPPHMLRLLTTMLTAYLWEDTPQNYYVHVFNDCMLFNAG